MPERAPAGLSSDVHRVAVGPLDGEARPHLVEDRRLLLDRHRVALGVEADHAAAEREQQQAVARLPVGRGEHPRLARHALALLGLRRGDGVPGEVGLGVLVDRDRHRPGEQRDRDRRAVLRARRRREEVAVPDAVLLGLVAAPARGVPHGHAVVAVEVGDERLARPAARSRRRRQAAARTAARLLEPVVRRFLRDDDVVDMALLEPGGGDLDEAGPGLELADAWRRRSSPCPRAGRRRAAGPWRRAGPCRAPSPRCPRARACRVAASNSWK